jgi:ATP-binding cassette, subfamily C, bacteriocin exporter
MLLPPSFISNTSIVYIPKLKASVYLFFNIMLASIVVILFSLPYVYTDISVKPMGITRPSTERTEVKSTITGLIKNIYFKEGNKVNAGELLSFYALIGYFTGPATSLIGANKNIQDALIAADRLFEIIDLETESTNESKVDLTSALIGDIQFHNVSFRYGTRVTVFEELNITLKKGASTAIVGESGSGKSTLLSLMQNLYPLKEGNITIGGIDIQYISNTSLRKIVSVVPQQIDLFVGTIIENIAIGEFEPDLQKILHLSKLLGISDFIEKLPATYNTILNENGVNLSGGKDRD